VTSSAATAMSAMSAMSATESSTSMGSWASSSTVYMREPLWEEPTSAAATLWAVSAPSTPV
jgi:hypothetical protein